MDTTQANLGGHPGPIRVTGATTDGEGNEQSFTGPFRVGRGTGCDVRVDSPLASRTHAEVFIHEGGWWIRDLGSTNGLWVAGLRVAQAPLSDGTLVQVGQDGPSLRFEVSAPPAEPAPPSSTGQSVTQAVAGGPTQATAEASGSPAPSPTDPSVSKSIERYFEAPSDRPAGEHTRMIQVAYQAVRKRENAKWVRIVAAGALLLVVSLSFGAFQRIQNGRLTAQAGEIFRSMKDLDVTIVNLRRLVEQQGGADLQAQLERLDAQRARLSEQYEGYVRDLGVYRKLRSEEERLIYQTARAFGESETTMSADFVERVQLEIDEYWGGVGRSRFRRGIARAEQSGYTEYIVQTLRRYGIPQDFFYLALQESDFIEDRVGPDTRWGRAKGMWQFIPETARRYGLNPGLKADSDEADPLDERQNAFLATDAAARYLLDLHGVLTQASGLLVMASYNWGEHRVIDRLASLPTPDAEFESTFQDIPADPEWRNYWRFLEEYGDRMPDQTKDYVLKIFAAAVVGRNPRYFGFDFDDPLASYVE
jgi:soluble lytic murein transglycosylase-like protein